MIKLLDILNEIRIAPQIIKAIRPKNDQGISMNYITFNIMGYTINGINWLENGRGNNTVHFDIFNHHNIMFKKVIEFLKRKGISYEISEHGKGYKRIIVDSKFFDVENI